MSEENKVKLTEVAVFNGGAVSVVMSLADTPQGGKAPVFTLVTRQREGLDPNTITLSELAVMSKLIEIALNESISMCSTVAGE